MTGVTTRDVLLSPQLAARWLAHSDWSDPERDGCWLNPQKLELYTAAMLAGDWRGGSIMVRTGPGGWLHDGEHRCAAVIQSKVPIWVRELYVHSVEEEAKTLGIDTARPAVLPIQASIPDLFPAAPQKEMT